MATIKKYKFSQADANTILAMGRQGASQKAMFAAIGISRATAARLKKEDPVFAETMDLATVHAQAYWENLMLANIENKSFNSRVAEIALRGQFSEDYRETREQKVDVTAKVTIDFNKEVSDLIASLNAASK
jgi:hypothetical protein